MGGRLKCGMPLHAYRCRSCGAGREDYTPISVSPPEDFPCSCGRRQQRVFHPPVVFKGFEPHFNASVGRYVSSEREFRAELSRASEAMSQRTGMDHNYVPLEGPDAREAAGVTDEGLDETHRRHRELGWTEPKTKVVDLGSS